MDYKSTSKAEEIVALDKDWQIGYKRQMEIYQWLFRKSGFKVSSVGYFLYVNGSKLGNFYENGIDGVMHFETTLISHKGDDTWVEDAVERAITCLQSEVIPDSGVECDNCRYYSDRQKIISKL